MLNEYRSGAGHGGMPATVACGVVRAILCESAMRFSRVTTGLY